VKKDDRRRRPVCNLAPCCCVAAVVIISRDGKQSRKVKDANNRRCTKSPASPSRAANKRVQHTRGRPTGWERSLGNIQNYSARQPTQIYAGAETRPLSPDQARPTGGRDTTKTLFLKVGEGFGERAKTFFHAKKSFRPFPDAQKTTPFLSLQQTQTAGEARREWEGEQGWCDGGGC